MQALPYILLGASAIGTVFSARAQYQAGAAEEAGREYTAQITERKAAQEELASREKLRKLMAGQRALYAKAGVDISSGSPLLVLAETAAEGEKEALAIRAGGLEEAELERYYGRQAGRAGKVRAAGTLLTGLGRAGAGYYAMSRKTKATTPKTSSSLVVSRRGRV